MDLPRLRLTAPASAPVSATGRTPNNALMHLFAKLFERGGVSNEFGHVSGYIQACERFGFRVPNGLATA
jgi:hypothetical protein